MTVTPDYVLRNRVAWDRWAADYAGPGLRNWEAPDPTWGIWSVTEEQLGVLPPELAGLDSIELGCGTGYVSAWLARRGARPAGLDNSAAQLETARLLQERFGLRFPLVHASASTHRSQMTPSIWRFLSTARASGATRTPGSLRRRGCCAPAGS